MAGTMRQLEERQLPAEVTTMLWSPKMDLLATSNVKGQSLKAGVLKNVPVQH